MVAGATVPGLCREQWKQALDWELSSVRRRLKASLRLQQGWALIKQSADVLNAGTLALELWLWALCPYLQSKTSWAQSCNPGNCQASSVVSTPPPKSQLFWEKHSRGTHHHHQQSVFCPSWWQSREAGVQSARAPHPPWHASEKWMESSSTLQAPNLSRSPDPASTVVHHRQPPAQDEKP